MTRLQSYNKKVIDARSFAEIWAACDEEQHSRLTDKISEKLEVTDQAVWHYGKGHFAPRTLSAKKDVVQAVRLVLKINTTPTTLFPPKK